MGNSGEMGGFVADSDSDVIIEGGLVGDKLNKGRRSDGERVFLSALRNTVRRGVFRGLDDLRNNEERVLIIDLRDAPIGYERFMYPLYLEDTEIASEEFFLNVERTLSEIFKYREDAGLKKYSEKEVAIFFNEAYRVAKRYGGRMRKDGSDVFLSHLLGAVNFLVTHIGRTDLPVVLAMLNHDRVEDFADKKASKDDRRSQERNLYKELVSGEYWEVLSQLDGDEMVFEKLLGKVKYLVKGVTKLRRFKDEVEDREKTSIDTFLMFLKLSAKNLDILAIKLADRLHNLSTIGGHNEQKRKEIIDETLVKYFRLASVLRLFKATDYIADVCFNLVNPDLKSDFDEELEKRRLDPMSVYSHKTEILDVFNGLEDVSVSLEPVSLAYLILKHEIDPYGVEFRDFKVLDVDPLVKINVLIDTKEEERYESLSKVVSFIQESFGDYGINVSIRYSDDESAPNSPVRVTLINSKFGGRLVFSVNTVKHNNLFKQGFLSKSSMPYRLGVMLEQLVGELGGRGGKCDLYRVASSDAFRSRVVVLDKNGKHRYFPVGSTILDFAASVHLDFLIGFVEAYAINPKTGERHEVSIAEPLVAGFQYYLVNSIDKGVDEEKRIAQSRFRLQWLSFMKPHALSIAKIYLAKLSEEVRMKMAYNYVAELCRVYCFTLDRFYEIMAMSHEGEDKSRLLNAISLGDIDPLADIANLFADKYSEFLKIVGEDNGGREEFFTFGLEVGFEGVDDFMHVVETLKSKDVGVSDLSSDKGVMECSVRFSFDSNYVDMLKVFMQLSYLDGIGSVALLKGVDGVLSDFDDFIVGVMSRGVANVVNSPE